MSILWRSWLTFSVVLATVLGVLTTLTILQHSAILSDLVRQRIAVVASTTAAAFRSIVDLGLPLSAMRHGDAVVARALQTDPKIRAIHVFNPSGVEVYTTGQDRAAPVSGEIVRAQQLADDVTWSVETGEGLDSGFSVVNRGGDVVGGVVVGYPKDEFNAKTHAPAVRTVIEAIVLWLVFSGFALAIQRVLLSAPMRVLTRLRADSPGEDRDLASGPEPERAGPLEHQLAELQGNLVAARRYFERADSELKTLAHGDTPADPSKGNTEPPPEIVEQSPAMSLARVIARKLAPWAALLIVVSALIRGGSPCATSTARSSRNSLREPT